MSSIKPYISEIIENNQYVAVIINASYESPIELLSQIEADLRDKNIRGNVLFDMLLRNGNSKDRFLSIFYDGINFDNETAKMVTFERFSPLRKMATEILCRYPNYLDNSNLNDVQRNLVKHGCVI